MAKLWETNKEYDASEPQSRWNMPYKRLYQNLTPKELAELLQDARRLRWEVLDLSSTKVSALPKSIGNLTSLQSLDLSSTKVSALPNSIGNLTSLQRLYLWNTNISALPDSIGNLTNLQELGLNGTNISALPDSIGNLKKLQWLHLRGTLISALPDSIGNLTNLQSLYLSNTEISALPDSIGNLKNLRTLKLCACHLKEIPYSVVALGLPFVINNDGTENCVNLTGVTLDEGDLQLFAQPREAIEAHYREKARAISQRNAVIITPPAPPVPKPDPPTQDERTQRNLMELSNQVQELRRQLSESERRNAYRTGVKVAVGVGAALLLLLARRLDWFDWLIELFDLLT